MLAVTDPKVHTVTIMACTQLLKTELINNTIGYFVHLDPSPIIVMQPTDIIAKAWSQDRLDKMIRDTPVLNDQFVEKKSRDSGNTILHKEFPGGHITMVGSNSPASLSSRPVRIILCDEVDRYSASAGKEGDPIKLISERSTTFWNAKHIFVSSPTIEGQSRIDSEYQQSDKRIYEVPCWQCGIFSEMKWARVKWDNGDPETTRYLCEHCEQPWTEAQRLQAIKKGKWRATAPFKGHAGFRANKLVSPWESLSKIVEKFLSAKKEPEKLKVFINTQLAETYKEKGEAPDWEKLYDRREDYEIGTVPNGVMFLTAGADVQENRIEVEVVGWCRDKSSYSIERFVYEGSTAAHDDPDPKNPWKKLDALLNETWADEFENRFSIVNMAVDSGYRSQVVYNWCRKYPLNRVIATKGSERIPVLMNHGTLVDVKKGNDRLRRGLKLYTIGVSIAKTELYGWLQLPSPTPTAPALPGYCHFPDYDDEFFKQLTAESMVTRMVSGRPVRAWEKSRARNEALDCRVYARAAAAFFGMDRFKERHWDKMAIDIPQKKAQNVEKAKESLQIKRRKSSFL